MFLCSFLWIEITFAFFHSLGNTLFLIQDLNFIWRGLIIDSPLILTMLMLFISWPWALLGLKFWTFFKILFLLTLTDEAEFSFFFFFFFENDKRTLLELSLMMHWSAKKDLKNSAFSHNYFDKTVTEYTEFFVIWKCLQNWPIRLCTNDWIHHFFSYRWVVFLLIFFNWESQLNLEIFNCIK